MLFSEFQNDTLDLTIDFYGYEQCTPSYGFGPAIRENYVLHYIESGRGIFVYNGKTIKLGPGDLFILKPNELTYYESDPEEPWAYYWLGISGSKAQNYFNLSELSHKGYLTINHHNTQNSIAQIIKSMILKSEEHLYSASNQLHLLSRLYDLLFQLATIAPKKKTKDISNTQKLCNDCRHFIETRYMSNHLNIQTIAEKLGVNRSYLTSIFSEAFKISPKEYLDSVRMNRAKFLLENTKEPIKTISISVGYTDALYFSKAFKHHYGVSPTDYRNKLT